MRGALWDASLNSYNAAILADPAKLAAVNGSVPLQRAGTPAEVAALIAWVASSEARYATGAVFVVDGGMTAI
jgi:NAD(P)-dependent dehydrogenase (short-subunit alcohol dehydrogenase family)